MPAIDIDKTFFYKLNHLKSSFDTYVDQLLIEVTGVGLAPRSLLSSIRHNQPATQQHIAAFMGLTPGAISRQVDAAKKKGWVVIRDHESDRRKQILELAPAGLKILEDGDDCVMELASKLFPSPDERTYLLECLDKVQYRVDKLIQSK